MSDRRCQRFLPPGPPSTTPIRAYLANRLIRTSPDSHAVPDRHAGHGAAPPEAVRPIVAVEDTEDGAGVPPAIAPPLGREPWSSEPGAGSPFSLGSASHAGPSEVEADKGNQDFAFHMDLVAPDGAVWLVAGVADGVSQATWSSRAAQHASAAFVESVVASFSAPSFPATAAKLGRDDWPDALAQAFHGRLRARLEEDRRFLFEGRYLDPTWAPQAYREAFLTGHDAFASTAKSWFQTTLLAAALGPEGGFALFLGDGYARVERHYPDRAPEISASLDPTPMISLAVTQAQVRRGIVRLASKGASHLGVLLSTDGVSRSPEAAISGALREASVELVPGASPSLDRAVLRESGACRRFLAALAKDPSADRDNMSVALAFRPLSPSGVSL